MSVTEQARARPLKRQEQQQNARPFVSLSRAAFKGFIRDKATLFWILMFPLMFLVIFGLLLGDSGSSKTEIGVVGDGPVVAALEQTGAVELTRFDSESEALEQVTDGDLPAYVSQNGGEVTMRYAASDQNRASTVLGLVNGVVSEANIAATGQQRQFDLTASRVEDESLKPIQFLTPGLLAWAVAMSAVFGAALTLVTWRKNQVLRRLRLAPVSSLTILNSRVAVAIGTALVQGAVFVGLAVTPLFGLQLSGQWWLAVPMLMLGTLSFFAIGMLLGAFAKTEESASGAGNLLILSMAFLSGAFFPIDLTPDWVQRVSLAFPMRHLNDGLSAVLVRGQGIEALLVPAAVLTAFTVVVGLIAVRVFRWEAS